MKSTKTKILGLALLLGGLALGGFGLSVLLRVPQFEATARIKGEMEFPPGGSNDSNTSFDPYFIYTTFEILQSEVILSNVVTTLNLEIIWGDKFAGGKKLSTHDAMGLLRGRMILAPVRNTKLVTISVLSDDPVEAAKIANAIAGSYINYCLESRRQLKAKGLTVLQQAYDDQTKEIQALQTNVDELRKQLGTSDSPTIKQAYHDAQFKLNQLMDQHKLFHAKMDSDQIDAGIPKDSIVQLIDMAEPPKSPIGPSQFLGAILLAAGLISSLTGLLLIKAANAAAD